MASQQLNVAMQAIVLALSIMDFYSVLASDLYKGFSVYRCIPQTYNHMNRLNDLLEQNVGEIQFWTLPVLNQSVLILAGPREKSYLRNLFSSSNMKFDITVPDVKAETLNQLGKQRVLSRILSNDNDETQQQKKPKAVGFYDHYQSYDSMVRKILYLAENDPRVQVEVIGRSYENRRLYLVKISSNHEAGKPVIFIDGGHHAREWISPATALYLLESLVNCDIPRVSPGDCQLPSCFEETKSKTELRLDTFDYWFVPVVNPDGYEFSRLKDRFWRKTRSYPERKTYCFSERSSDVGVDPNRNYPFHWAESGTSGNPCSETFSGSEPLSEPETLALARSLTRHGRRIKMYISLHSFAQMILAPYGYAKKVTTNHQRLMKLAELWVDSVKRINNTEYKLGTSAILLGEAAGGSDDYAFARVGIEFSYTIELPDKGSFGFLLPASKIIQVAHESLIGLRAMADGLENMIL